MTRMRSLGLATAIVGVVVPALLLAGCSSGSPSPDTGGTNSTTVASATVPIGAPISTLDPIVDVASATEAISTMFESLTFTGGDKGKVLPWLATSWDTEDNITWTFHLDKKATFHNGDPVTADDVVFTYQTEQQPTNPHSSTLATLASISAVDEHTVQMVLKAPNAAWIVTIGQLYIVSKNAYEKEGADGFAKAPVGSGPFKFVDLTSGGGVDMEGWSGYRDGAPPIKKLSYVPVTSPQSQLAGLEAGDLDLVANVPYNQIAQVKGTPGLEIVSKSSTNSIYLGYNIGNPALADVAVRKAIDEAIDRSTLVKKVFDGEAVALGNLVPKATFGYDDAIKPTAFDAAAAKKALKAAGYDGSEIPLSYPTSLMPQADELGRAVGAYLSDIGLNVKLQPMDYTTFVQQWVGKTLPGLYLFQYRNGVDAEFVITSLFAANSRALFTDPDLAALVTQERAAVDSTERLATLRKLWDLGLTQDRCYSPILSPNIIYGQTKGLPFPANPSGLISFSYAGEK
jgi:peptide/nickel transport system substrate-binding protein